MFDLCTNYELPPGHVYGNRIFFQACSQKWQLADGEEKYSDFDKKCVRLWSLTMPLTQVLMKVLQSQSAAVLQGGLLERLCYSKRVWTLIRILGNTCVYYFISIWLLGQRSTGCNNINGVWRGCQSSTASVCAVCTHLSTELMRHNKWNHMCGWTMGM